jgi:hypothetical protein
VSGGEDLRVSPVSVLLPPEEELPLRISKEAEFKTQIRFGEDKSLFTLPENVSTFTIHPLIHKSINFLYPSKPENVS